MRVAILKKRSESLSELLLNAVLDEFRPKQKTANFTLRQNRAEEILGSAILIHFCFASSQALEKNVR